MLRYAVLALYGLAAGLALAWCLCRWYNDIHGSWGGPSRYDPSAPVGKRYLPRVRSH